jgi:hypothetical protein
MIPRLAAEHLAHGAADNLGHVGTPATNPSFD